MFTINLEGLFFMAAIMGMLIPMLIVNVLQIVVSYKGNNNGFKQNAQYWASWE